MAASGSVFELVKEVYSPQHYNELNWEGSFEDYIEIVQKNPKVARSAFSRMYDLIMHFGTYDFVEHKKKLTHYKFFDDPLGNGKDAVFGLDVHIAKLVNFFKAASLRYGTEKRVLLLVDRRALAAQAVRAFASFDAEPGQKVRQDLRGLEQPLPARGLRRRAEVRPKAAAHPLPDRSPGRT